MIYYYNDTPIFYTLQGKGTPWVLLHGFLESSSMWNDVVSDFSESHTIVTIDLPGHGKSGIIAESHSMELMAEVVLSVLNKLNISFCTLIGHSMGGYIALALAEKQPALISKLVLLNSSPAEDSEERKKHRNRTLRIIKTNKEAFIRMAISNLFSERSIKKQGTKIELLIKEATQLSTEAVRAAIVGIRDRKDRVSVLGNFINPKFMISGIEDPIIPIQEAESLAKKTNTTLFKIDEGHMSWLESVKELKKILHLIDK